MIRSLRDSTTIRYGSSRHQVATLRAPARNADERDGTVAVLHGGSWRWPYGRAVMRLVVEDLRRHGWWVADVEYRRLGRFGGGGGYPETFDDIVDAIGAVEELRSARTAVVGHSAGGHLALATALWALTIWLVLLSSSDVGTLPPGREIDESVATEARPASLA